ncbi:MAG: tetratricopeptide repeat protein [Elusimicrobia bacterium]|nr:tetratricopeptide repeat protein [Elusimicrobiota bacterium]
MDLKLYDRAILDFNEALQINPNDTGVQQLYRNAAV